MVSCMTVVAMPKQGGKLTVKDNESRYRENNY
jgi:hypothetical protein